MKESSNVNLTRLTYGILIAQKGRNIIRNKQDQQDTNNIQSNIREIYCEFFL